MFLVVEGIDGAGKSTLIQKILLPIFGDQDVVYTFEPGGTDVGSKLRDVILNHDLLPVSTLLLLMAARCEHITHVINPALHQGNVVISDRFSGATRAYQQYGFGLDAELIDSLEMHLPKTILNPVTIYLDISPKQARGRMKTRGSMTCFDSMPLDFHARVRQGYIDYFSNDARSLIIDSTLPARTLKRKILRFLLTINH